MPHQPHVPTPRERFLARIEPVWDGPVLLATKIRPIDHARSRVAAAAGRVPRGIPAKLGWLAGAIGICALLR
jgi:hypothetical protein